MEGEGLGVAEGGDVGGEVEFEKVAVGGGEHDEGGYGIICFAVICVGGVCFGVNSTMLITVPLLDNHLYKPEIHINLPITHPFQQLHNTIPLFITHSTQIHQIIISQHHNHPFLPQVPGLNTLDLLNHCIVLRWYDPKLEL